MSDKELLDWLEKHAWLPNPTHLYGSLEANLDLPFGADMKPTATDLRSAIVETIKQLKKENGE